LGHGNQEPHRRIAPINPAQRRLLLIFRGQLNDVDRGRVSTTLSTK
jgi:hypothetical protein